MIRHYGADALVVLTTAALEARETQRGGREGSPPQASGPNSQVIGFPENF